MNGWTVVATLRHRPGRPTMVQPNGSGGQIDVEAWSRSEGWCEHCRTRRVRHTTYLLRDPRGRLAQVGANCLAEFTGCPNPMRALRRASRTHAPRSTYREPGPGPAAVEYVDTGMYLVHVAQAVLDGGFVSSSAATRGTPATWSVAAAALDVGHPPGQRASRRAEQALAWVRDELASRQQLTQFEQRLVTVVGEDRLTRRELPTAAAAIYAYHQELHRRIAARRATGEHLGTPGETVVTAVTVQRIERAATAHGSVLRHFMTDDVGRRIVWDSIEGELTVGACRMRATVLAHRMTNARAVTILDRCEVLRPESLP